MHCILCSREVNEFLTHLYLEHNIKTVEEYQEQAELRIKEMTKEIEYQQKVVDLIGMLNRKEITAEQYRSRIVLITK